MLESLKIENFALIDSLTLKFAAGFNVITGETGAGKSILIDAINVVLGERASSDLIQTGKSKARIEAKFWLAADHPVMISVKEQGLPHSDLLSFAREISPGRSQAYVNGKAVSQSLLKSFSAHLIDIHGQHSHQALFYPENHLEILDSFGDTAFKQLKDMTRLEIRTYKKILQQIEFLTKSAKDREAELDYLNHQINEIESLNLQTEEDIKLLQESGRLKNMQKISDVFKDYQPLRHNLSDQLQKMSALIQKLNKLDETTIAVGDTSEQMIIAFDELQHQMNGFRAELDLSPQQIEALDDRLDQIRNLVRKHFHATLSTEKSYVTDLLEKLNEMKKLASNLDNAEGNLDQLKKELIDQEKHVVSKAQALSDARLALAGQVQTQVEVILKTLGMPHGKFVVQIRPALSRSENAFNFNNLKVELFDTGIDQVELLISPNLGEPPRPLAQIASGGEISRVMLALKSIFVSDPIQTVIFDEIDTGIGGETAIAVGKQIKSLAHNKQVFCITHLAQIASQADHHYKVEKIAQDNRTIVTAVLLQSPKALQEEISRMLSGTKTKESIKHAQELLSR
jgi:DNA repair protein RecN (Recombination protein N)